MICGIQHYKNFGGIVNLVGVISSLSHHLHGKLLKPNHFNKVQETKSSQQGKDIREMKKQSQGRYTLKTNQIVWSHRKMWFTKIPLQRKDYIWRFGTWEHALLFKMCFKHILKCQKIRNKNLARTSRYCTCSQSRLAKTTTYVSRVKKTKFGVKKCFSQDNVSSFLHKP